MILIDTNILVDYWNKGLHKEKFESLKDELVLCGVVKSEMLTGSRSNFETNEMIEMFEEFSFISFDDSEWIEHGKLTTTLRSHGLKVPFPDSLITYLALKTDSTIWTNDKHFHLMQQVFPNLKLM